MVMFLATAILSGFGGIDQALAQTAQVTAAVPLEDFLAEKAGRVKPSELKAAAARQAAAVAVAKQKQRQVPEGAAAVITVPPIGPGDAPDYYTTPNWANSPPLTKFIDPLPSIPVANPDTVTYAGSDYYEIELRQYSQQMHSEMPPTLLRGYVQTNNGTDGSGNNTVAPSPIRYLGPTIVARKDRPVRIKFVNALPPGEAGRLFVPVDTTIMGSGLFEIDYDPLTLDPISPNLTGEFSENRGVLHLHGGRTSWISDGTPHQWITPAAEGSPYAKGVSVEYVPDMWFEADGNTIAECAGQLTCAVAGATNDPGPGAQTYHYTNQQSARLLFYHDHSWGITRLNVYVGEAAGYLITDDAEQQLLDSGLIPSDQIPLIIQDKTFVDPATITTTDPTWEWGSQPWNGTPGAAMTPVEGDLWWPHVYMPAQNPFNPDQSGINAMGRWMYGPWFWPPTPLCADKGGPPQAVKPLCIDVGTVPNPYYDPYCDPLQWGFCQPPEIPGTPTPSWGAEAFLDTPVVNGAAYPILEVEPKAYRFRLLNASHDRFLNLQLYRAVSKNGPSTPGAGTPIFDAPAAELTEVAMVLAAPTAGFPEAWPTDGREGGVPDPATSGPAMIQIGTEGGFLPEPVLLTNQPVNWNTDPTMFTAGLVLQVSEGGGTLFLAPAERADVIVDFSNYAGKTLILYNDAPTAFPALDPHYDYYTGAPDRTDMGGYTEVLPGVGPNVRTVMQIRVSGSGGTAPVNDYNPDTLSNLQGAFASSGGVPGVFAAAQDPIIVGQTAYNGTYDTVFPAEWPTWGVSRISDTFLGFRTVNPDLTISAPVSLPMEAKAIQDEMGETFDDFGRMSAKLGLTIKFANATNATFIVQNYVDPTTEILYGEGVQLWKITHNGVDTHPIHFHLFDVQLINRVAWDGFITLPDTNELGWKDTVRVSPLQDTIVALRPVIPTVPFPIPDSVRPLNPAIPLGSMMGFSQVDPATGGALAIPQENEIVNFGWEYVWHCHILSHEENDMMRSMLFIVPPQAPSNVTAIAGTLSATVSFDLPGATGGSPILSYTVTSSPGGFTATGAGSPIVVPGLAACETYTFTVTATNAVGTGVASGTSNAVTIPDSVPGAPLGPTAVPGNTEATISFLPPALPVGACSPILDYTVTSDPGGFTATSTGSPITVPGLTNGTAYRFFVTARNDLGSGAPSEWSNSVIPGTPGAPTTVTAVKGNASATVSFVPPVNSGAAPIDFYTATSDPGGISFSGAGSPITVPGLTNGTPYTFTVTASNTFGAGPAGGPSNSVTPSAVPDAPTGVTAVADTTSATISFTPPLYDGGSAILYYTVTSHPSLIRVSGAGSPITITMANGLLSSVPYFFTVTATNAAGTGPDGGPSNTVTLNAPPTDLALTPSVVDENVPVGTPVGTFTTTDPNPGDTFTYTLVAGTGDTGNGSFTIFGDQLLTAAVFDFETTPSYSIRVRTTDAGGLWVEKQLTVSVYNDTITSSFSNLAARGKILTGANVMFGGFTINGTTPRTMVIRGLGPSLRPLGVPGTIADPVLTLYSGSTPIATNDDWGALDPGRRATLAVEGLTPGNAMEAALVETLSPGAYTVILRGDGNGTGVGIVELYETSLWGASPPDTGGEIVGEERVLQYKGLRNGALTLLEVREPVEALEQALAGDAAEGPDLVPPSPVFGLSNLAARLRVGTGADVLIGGFVIRGTEAKTVVLRGIGPSLAAYGVPGTLPNPLLEVYSGATRIASNDNWGTLNPADRLLLAAKGLTPAKAQESALVLTLMPGAYTVIVKGVSNTVGVGMVEAYDYDKWGN
jgi:FtsP/CotA-like multicopper oxidase with cupredoxin domain